MTYTRQDEWMITDGMGEYVEYYNPTGHVMHFTRDREQARRTTSHLDAAETARIAKTVYGRKYMGLTIVL